MNFLYRVQMRSVGGLSISGADKTQAIFCCAKIQTKMQCVARPDIQPEESLGRFVAFLWRQSTDSLSFVTDYLSDLATTSSTLIALFSLCDARLAKRMTDWTL
jgi:hypothetical protein